MRQTSFENAIRPRWLVTGARGFLGNEVCGKLNAQNIEVIAVDKKPSMIDVEWEQIVMDMNVQNVMHLRTIQFDGVIHLAALKSVQESISSPNLYHANNVEVSKVLLEISREKGVNNFIFVSSASVYKSSEIPISEHHLIEPLSPYGHSKAEFEKVLISEGATLPRNTVIIRPFNIVGCNVKGELSNSVVTKVLRSIKHDTTFNENFKINIETKENISPIRDYIDVSDVAEIITKFAIKSQETIFKSRIVVNACSGVGKSLTDVIRASEAYTGKKLCRVICQLDSREILVSIGMNKELESNIIPPIYMSLEESIRKEWHVIQNEED